MQTPELVGAVIVGLPALVVAYLALWRRYRQVFWFAVALIAVGLGYLASTGALADIAGMILHNASVPQPGAT